MSFTALKAPTSNLFVQEAVHMGNALDQKTHRTRTLTVSAEAAQSKSLWPFGVPLPVCSTLLTVRPSHAFNEFATKSEKCQ